MKNVYDIYHDESKENGYWHGFLFVPRSSRADLVGLLQEARAITNYPGCLHYHALGTRTKPHYGKAIITQAWTTIGCASLQQQKLQTVPPKIFLGCHPQKSGTAQYRVLEKLFHCRFVLLRERDSHAKMFSGLSTLQCIETTFRMGIKGGVHKLFSDRDPITIGNVFIDGDEHYIGEFGRTFDVNRTLIRLAREKRPHVSFLRQPKIIPQRSDHRTIESNQHPDDSHLLQLCDVLIGGTRFHVCSSDPKHVRYHVSSFCRELLDHEQNNPARMAQSRYLHGFSLNEAWLEREEWNFAPLVTHRSTAKSTAMNCFRSGL